MVSFLPDAPNEACSDDNCDHNVRMWYGREHHLGIMLMTIDGMSDLVNIGSNYMILAWENASCTFT